MLQPSSSGGIRFDASLHEIAGQIRKLAFQSVYHARSGHPGGAFSAAEILAALYFRVMKVRPNEPRWPDRDRLVLSKGHSCPGLYATLALRSFFPEKQALELRKISSMMEGHPDVGIPGIDAPSGSLGMGLSQGVGMALAARYTKKDYRTFVILGDGDMQEGNTWEALLSAGFFKLGNLVGILDANKIQGDALVSKQMDYFPVIDKIRAFQWDVREIDGHDAGEVQSALEKGSMIKDRPSFIIAHTVKGKGVSFMENAVYWHGSVTIKDEELGAAMKELEARYGRA